MRQKRVISVSWQTNDQDCSPQIHVCESDEENFELFHRVREEVQGKVCLRSYCEHRERNREFSLADEKEWLVEVPVRPGS